MAKLIFDATAIRPIVEHMMNSTEWAKGYGETGKPGPQLILVHDEGIYCMSNGVPGLMAGDGERHVVAYAKGYNPHTDEDVWDRARDAVGGDDFGEHLTLSPDQIASILGGDFKRLEINVNKRSISIAVITNAPAATRPATDAEVSKQLQRVMRTRLLFVRDGAVRQTNPVPAAFLARLRADKAYCATVTEQYKASVVLNVLTPADALAAYRKVQP